MARILFVGSNPVPHEELQRHIVYAKSLGLPYVPHPEPKDIVYHDRTLAVVGGGPSVVEHLEELRGYQPEDIWAVNGACAFLRQHGIDSTLFTLDPLAVLAKRVEGAKRAILCSRCHPNVFEALKGASIRLFDMMQDMPDEVGVWGSCSTILSSFDLGSDLGYRKIVFYGCEGSFTGVTTHAYMDDPQKFLFVVECGGLFYKTLPELYTCAVEHAKFLRMKLKPPASWTEKSGGLLRALVANPEHDFAWVSRSLMDDLKPITPAQRELAEVLQGDMKADRDFNQRVRELGDYHAALNEMG